MKVIFISGYTEDPFRKRLGNDDDIHFLPKPFSLKQLASKVKEVMQEFERASGRLIPPRRPPFTGAMQTDDRLPFARPSDY